MKSKTAAKKVGKKPANKKSKSRRAIPAALIVRMVEAGADALTIAKRVDRVNDGPDKTHSIRAIISHLRRGYKDHQGKTHCLKVERVGQTKKPKKSNKKTVAPKATPKPVATAKTQPDRKTLATGEGSK
jgi:hypothetical protein